MKFKSIITQTAFTGLLTGIGVIIALFFHFRVLGGQIYLVALPIFLMPFILKLRYSILGAATTVVLADFFNGWISYTWISVIAYVIGIIILWTMNKLIFKFIFILGVIAASAAITLIYFVLETIVIDKAYAIDDLITTSIEFAIIFPIIIIIYRPIKLLKILS